MKFFKKEPKREKVDIQKRFEVGAPLGQGSMSTVCRAFDQISGRECALKILDKHKMERYEARFPGMNKPPEGDVALTLKHPNIVETTEWGWTTNDEQFLVMEHIQGVGLGMLVDMQGERMARHRLRYMIQIGVALDFFHKSRWIHRDLCPRNIMVSDKDNQIKLIDFGLVVPNTPDFCKPGNRTGTANYMAPELIKRQKTDERIDVFSYAVTCFEMYSKRTPWDAALSLEAVIQHINKPPEDLEKLVPGIDPEVVSIINKGLSLSPDDRWQTTMEMAQAFSAVEARLVAEREKVTSKDKQKKAAKKAKLEKEKDALKARAKKASRGAAESSDKDDAKPSEAQDGDVSIADVMSFLNDDDDE